MSFLSDIVDFAGGAIDWLGGNTLGAGLARTAILGWGLNKVQSSIQKENAVSTSTNDTATADNNPTLNPIPDAGVRLQVSPDPDHKIPIVYGTAHIGGIITDAELANSNQNLWVTLTLSERTGVKLSDNVQSVISFKNVFIDDERVIFDNDGVTLLYTIDRDGNQNNNWEGLIEVYCYNNGSNSGVYPTGYSGSGIPSAHTLMPSWSSLYTMNELVFAVVKLTYSPQKGLQKIPTFRFELSNTMTQPGDCLLDYMTNTRYGAGIPSEEIYSV